MKRQSTLAIFFLLAITVSAHGKDWTHVRIATEGGFPPFSDIAVDGSLFGLDVDIGNAICAEMKLRCTWIKTPWETMIPTLISQKSDAIVASMTITEERKKKVDFTDKYYSSPLAFVAKRGSPLRPGTGLLKGKKVGVERGTVADHFVTRFWGGKGVEVIRYRLQDEVYLDLVAGRLDATVTDYWQALGGFLNKPLSKDFAIVGEKIYGTTPEERAVVGEGIGIAVRKEDTDLKETLNKGLAAIRKNGTYDRIVKKYFSEDIYGP